MKWIWHYIVDDNGKPVEEEVTEEEFNYREKMIEEGVECLREVAKASRKQNEEFFNNMKEKQTQTPDRPATVSTKTLSLAVVSISQNIDAHKEARDNADITGPSLVVWCDNKILELETALQEINTLLHNSMNEEQNREFAKLSTKHGVVAITSGSYFLQHGKEMPIEDKLEFLRHLDESKITTELDAEINKDE